MLDHPVKTARLLAELKAALPFTIALTEEVIALVGAQKGGALRASCTVTDLSYAGDEGGIMCHLAPSDGGGVVISLTHVRVPPSMPLFPAIVGYQRHRVKKIKKAGHHAGEMIRDPNRAKRYGA
jgi:hypothetical protein